MTLHETVEMSHRKSDVQCRLLKNVVKVERVCLLYAYVRHYTFNIL